MQGDESIKNLEKNKGVFQAASAMALGTLSSRILGLFRDIVMSAFLSRTMTDAWLVAFRIPNLFRSLLGEGALNVSFIPVFTDLVLKGKSAKNMSEPEQLIAALLTLLMSVILALVLFIFLFAEEIVSVFVSGEAYIQVPGKVEMTVRWTRIMSGFLFFMIIYAYFMAILNSLRSFALPALAPVFFNIAIILSCFFPLDFVGAPGDGVAWAVLIGGSLQVAILIPLLKRKGFFPRLSFQWKNPALILILKNMFPGFIGMAVLQLTVIVNTRFASELPEGANSWIFWADRLLELPLSLFAVSLGTALLPTLSELWYKGRIKEMGETMTQSLNIIMLFAIPCAVGFYFLSLPIVQVVFQRAQFTLSDAIQTALVLQIYAGAVITYSWIRVLAPTFYAVKNTWYPALVGMICLIIHVFLAPDLMETHGLKGLALSTLVVSVLNGLLLYFGYLILIGPFPLLPLCKNFVKYILAASVMYGVIQLYSPVFQILGTSYIARASSLFFIIGICILVYFIILKFLNVDEVSFIKSRINRFFSLKKNN